MSIERKTEAVLHAIAVWTLSSALLIGSMMFLPYDSAVAIRLITSPLVALIVSTAFFTKYEDAQPASVALLFASTMFILDAIVLAGVVQRSLRLFVQTPLASWVVYASVMVATWASGTAMVQPRPTPRH